MATLSKAESRRMYSWWWDSHISPKNSKWLKENLTDMDLKVKAMIKLIEEDADSFARRAEMYYKKRPELMKLVEEFYRAYRALAERYDHATGALRQAHKTMQEAFPNQIPFVMTDETHPSSSVMESGPHAPEIAPNSPHFDPDGSHMDDAMGSPSHFHARKRNGPCTEEHDTLSGRSGLKQLIEVAAGSKFDGGRERKSPEFQEEEIEVTDNSKRNGLRDPPKHGFIQKRDLSVEIKHLQEEILQLSKENQDLDNQISLETQRADKAEAEAQVLQGTLSRLNSEKEAAYIRYQQSLEKLTSLEAEMSRMKEEFKDLNDKMLMGVENFNKAEERHLVLEKNNEALQLELDTLKRQHNELIERMMMIDLHVVSLQASLKDLENEKLEVQAICRKREDEKQMILDELKNMEKVSETNLVLENSLSDAHAELEGLREKIKVLEESCESLHKQISLHMSEKAALASQVEAVSQKMEDLSEKNGFLENSLSDANVKLESSMGKLKELEESFYLLKDQYSTLLAEKNALLLQLEDIQQKLKDLEIRHEELQQKYLILEREKELALHQVSELQDFLKHEKQENEHLTLSSKSQKASLDSQIRKLQEEWWCMEEELEIEQFKFMNAQIEILILQRCLCEMKESNMTHSTECQKHLELLCCIEKQKSELEHDYLVQKQAAASLLEHNKKLRATIHDLLKMIRANKECPPVGNISDELLFQLAVSETKGLLNSLSEVKDQNQHLIIDSLVTVTLLKQLGMDAAGMKFENDVLEGELDGKNEELSHIRHEMQKLLEMNKHLVQDVQASNYRRNAFITEMEIISKWLSQLKDAHNKLKVEFLDLLREYQSLSFEIIDLKEIKEKLERENNVILSEAMTLDCLYSAFQSISKEKTLQLQKLSNDLDSIVDVRNGIDKENKILNEKIGMMEAENMHLNGLALSLESHRSHSMVLENDLQEARDVVFALSEDKACKENEVASLRQANEMLNWELKKVQKEAEQSKYNAEHLTSELQNQINEIKYCEVETVVLLDELHTKAINAEIFEEKVLELLLACETLETSAMIQREMLRNAIISRDVYQNELREKLNALAGPIALSLHDSIALLEESVLQLAKSHESNIQEKEDSFLAYHHQDKATPEETEDQNANIPVEVLQFQNLQAKVDALRDLVISAQNRLEEEKLPANAILVAQGKETEEQRSEKESSQLRASAGEVTETPLKMQEGNGEALQEFDGQLMKDIQLDRVSNSSPYSNGVGSYSQDNIENAGVDDQIFEPLITSQRDYTNSVEDASSLAKEHDIRCHEIQAVEEQRSEYPSLLVTEKELGVDKLELSKAILLEPQQAWNSRVVERLASDAERLVALQASAEVLKGKIMASNNGKNDHSIEFDAVKAQLKEAEETIKQLIRTNEELKKAAEDYSASSDSVAAEQNGKGEKSRKQLSVSARRGSEKIGRLELELQKIEYVFLKLKEEHEYRSRATGRRRGRVILKDFLYGRQNSGKQKKAHFCGCMRANTDSD